MVPARRAMRLFLCDHSALWINHKRALAWLSLSLEYFEKELGQVQIIPESALSSHFFRLENTWVLVIPNGHRRLPSGNCWQLSLRLYEDLKPAALPDTSHLYILDPSPSLLVVLSLGLA